MYLLWLRVAAILYAAAVSPSSRPCFYGSVRWRSVCVHLGGLAFFFHFVSLVEMLVQAHRWMPVGVREIESLLGFADRWAVLPGVVALRRHFTWNLCLAGHVFAGFGARAGAGPLHFPSEGVRISWLVAHIIALLLAYAALCFSLLACMLYLVQERRIKSKPKPGKKSQWASLDWLPPLDTLERIAHATLEFGFPCMTVGLVIGSVLAQETALGDAYFRDPKVIASFAMWVVYVLLLLVRRGAGLRGRQGGLCFRRGRWWS